MSTRLYTCNNEEHGGLSQWSPQAVTVRVTRLAVVALSADMLLRVG